MGRCAHTVTCPCACKHTCACVCAHTHAPSLTDVCSVLLSSVSSVWDLPASRPGAHPSLAWARAEGAVFHSPFVENSVDVVLGKPLSVSSLCSYLIIVLAPSCPAEVCDITNPSPKLCTVQIQAHTLWFGTFPKPFAWEKRVNREERKGKMKKWERREENRSKRRN